MKTSNLLLRFGDVEQGHEELVKLCLSTSASSSNPVSSSSFLGQQGLQLPCDSNSRKRLLSELSFHGEEDHEEQLNLSLSIGPPEPPSLFPHTSHDTCKTKLNLEPVPSHAAVSAAGSGPGGSSYHQRPRLRRNPFQAPKEAGKSKTIAAPYPWATTQRATVQSLENLLSRGISMISGHLECKECQETFEIEYNLQEKFKEIKDFISANKFAMHHRAPEAWLNPKLDTCEICGSSLKPVISKKRGVNWLFLLLGQMLGCCKLADLKYFCKHTSNHRTGAKDRVLYLTYLGLCKQLDPSGPFDV